MLTASERLEVLSWLCLVDYAQLYDTYSTARVPYTGDWLLKCSEFKDWLSLGASPVLYCPGPPGTGKTFLATRIIDFLFTFEPSAKVAVTYMYCDYSRHGEQNLPHFLSCLLRQLTHAADVVPQFVHELYTKHSRRNTRPTGSELLEALRAILIHEFEVVYVVVDALDECDSRTRCQLVKHLRAMAQDGNLRFLATSRSISEIDDLFCQDMQLPLEADDQDIREYVRVRTAEIQERLLFSEDVFSRIVGTIAPAVHGMFLLARLHMDTLKSKTSARDIVDALHSLPEGYNGAYQAAMARINNQDEGHRSLAQQVLMWVVCAKRPLLATELQHAIAIRSGDRTLRADGITRVGLFIAVCAGLVAVRHSSLKAVTSVKAGMVVHLAHYTAQEYFDRTRDDWFPEAQLAISRSCLSYLSLEEFETGPCDDDVQLKSRLGRYPFLEYAAIYWGLHAAMLKTDGDTHAWIVLQEAVGPLLQSSTLCDTTIQVQTLWSWFFSGDPADTPRQSTACHLFARWGFGQLCDYCHDVGIDVSALDSKDKPPFYYALETCPKSHVSALLSWSQQTELTKYGSLAFWHAVRHQEHQMITNLLASDSIDPNTEMFSDTPLIWAAISGHTQTVRTLAGCPRVDVNAVNDTGKNALFCAISNGHSDTHRDDMVGAILGVDDGRIVKLLVDVYKAYTNKQNNDGLTPDIIAARDGHVAVVKALFDSNASALNLRDNNGRSALYYAAKYGHVAVLKLLLSQCGMDVNGSDNFGETALMVATAEGQDGTVSMLLTEDDIDVNHKDHKGRTPLMHAIISGAPALMAYLARHDRTDINIKDEGGRTALWHACRRGHSSVALFLAEKNPINLYAFDLQGFSPLTLVDQTTGHKLLDSELVTDVSLLHRRNKFGYNTLHIAVYSGNIALTERLLRKEKLDIDRRNRNDETPLLLSVKERRTAIVRMLLQAIAVDLNAASSDGRRLVPKASAEDSLEVVRCIMNDSFSVRAFRMNQTNRNLVLSYAAFLGKEQMVKYLLVRDEINVFAHRRSGHWPPLTAAVRNGQVDICKMLVAETKRRDPDCSGNVTEWSCEIFAKPFDSITINEIIDLVHALGYIDFAAYCRGLYPRQVPGMPRLWGPYARCSVCGVLNLTKYWYCFVEQQLICHECVEAGFWSCSNRGHDLLELSANWYSTFPRFTGRRRSFNPCMRKRLEYWQGLISCYRCERDASDGYHCRICLDDHFDICDSCVSGEKYWCRSLDHSLKRNSSSAKQQFRPSWMASTPKIGMNLAGSMVRNVLAHGRLGCGICAAKMTHGYRCGLCLEGYVLIICSECTKDGRWCNDRSHLLQEYANDAVSFPWRSYEEIRSPRRKSFDEQRRLTAQKPERNRRYSSSDAGGVPYDEPWSFERWAERQLPYADTSKADSEDQDETNIAPQDDQTITITGRNKYRPEWEKWWPGGNLTNCYYESCGVEGEGQD